MLFSINLTNFKCFNIFFGEYDLKHFLIILRIYKYLNGMYKNLYRLKCSQLSDLSNLTRCNNNIIVLSSSTDILSSRLDSDYSIYKLTEKS